MKIQPLGNKVLVKISEEVEEKTKSGLYVPDTAKEKPQEGEVLAVGPGAINDQGVTLPMHVAVGDKVIFAKYAGASIKYNGEEYLIMPEDQLLAKLG